MWFAAMSIPAAYPWVFHLIWKLLNNDANALGLFASNPFPNNPPLYIRAVLYRYSSTKPGNEQGEWWNRERLALWLPPLSAGDPRLAWLLFRAGWLSPLLRKSSCRLRWSCFYLVRWSCSVIASTFCNPNGENLEHSLKRRGMQTPT